MMNSNIDYKTFYNEVISNIYSFTESLCSIGLFAKNGQMPNDFPNGIRLVTDEDFFLSTSSCGNVPFPKVETYWSLSDAIVYDKVLSLVLYNFEYLTHMLLMKNDKTICVKGIDVNISKKTIKLITNEKDLYLKDLLEYSIDADEELYV